MTPVRASSAQKAETTNLKIPGSTFSLVMWCAAALSIAPFFLNLTQFKELFYFGDEWDLISELAQQGLVKWSLLPLAESFAPLFKLLWGGAIHLSHGSYFYLLTLVWLSHFLIVITFGDILRRLGFTVFTTTAAMLALGLPWTNIESLTWSLQWSPLLATLFCMLAWRLLIGILDDTEGATWQAVRVATYGVLLIASALCFSRGIVSGPVLGFYILASGRSTIPARTKRVLIWTSFLVPVVLGAWMYAMMPQAGASPGALPNHYGAILAFGSYCLALNPMFEIGPIVLLPMTPAIAIGFWSA